MRRLIVLFIAASLCSCGISSARLVPQSGFKLSRSSVVCISEHPLSSQLESELLGLGIQVVPYEFARSSVISEEKGQSSDDHYTKVKQDYAETSIPAAIFIKIEGYDSMRFRFIDMETQRLLAVFMYKVDSYYESPLTKSPLKSFRKAIMPYIVP